MKTVKIVFFNADFNLLIGINKLFDYELSKIKPAFAGVVVFVASHEEALQEIFITQETSEIILITGSLVPQSNNLTDEEFITRAKKIYRDLIVIAYSYFPMPYEEVDAVINRFSTEGTGFAATKAQELMKQGGVYAEVSIEILFEFHIIDFMKEVLATKTRKQVFDVIEKYKIIEVIPIEE
jgi:hypothetical protein